MISLNREVYLAQNSLVKSFLENYNLENKAPEKPDFVIAG